MAINKKGVFTRKKKFDEIVREDWGVVFYYKGKHVFTINNRDKVLYY